MRRVELVLSVDSDRDWEISEFLQGLPRGAAAEFIRGAIYAAMDQVQSQNFASVQSEPNAQLETLIQEVTAQRREIAELREVVVAPVVGAVENPASHKPITDRRRRIVPEARLSPPSEVAVPSVLGEVESDGIDMSRPRRRSVSHAKLVSEVEQVPVELDEHARAALARELIRSIGAFGDGGN